MCPPPLSRTRWFLLEGGEGSPGGWIRGVTRRCDRCRMRLAGVAPLRGRGGPPAHRPRHRPEAALLGRLRRAGPVQGGEERLRVVPFVQGQTGSDERAGRAMLGGWCRVE